MTAATSRPKTLAVVLSIAALALLVAFAAPASAAKRGKPGSDTVAPTTPTDVAVSAASATSVTLTWSPSTDNVRVAYYLLVLGIEPAASSRSTTGTIKGLRCGSSYAAGVQAVDRDGNRSGRALLTVTTSPCPDSQAPTAPTSIRQLVTTGTSVVLGWSPSVDDVGVVGYGVYRAGLRVGSTAEPNVTLSGLTCGTTSQFALDAVDAAGNRSPQTAVYVTTGGCGDTQAPTAPTGLAVASRTTTGLGLSWTASSDNVGVSGYRVSVNGSPVGTATSTAFSISGLVCGTSYAVSVDAYDSAGNRSAAASVSASTATCPASAPTDTTPPTTPGSLAVQSASTSSVTLGWAPSTDDVGVSGYGVHRNGQQVQTASAAPSTVAGLACGTATTLAVDAFDAAGNRSAKAEVVATTAPCADTQAPTVPTNLVTTSRTSTSIALSWSASTDDVGVTSYGAYRGGSRVATTTERTTVFAGLTCGRATRSASTPQTPRATARPRPS